MSLSRSKIHSALPPLVCADCTTSDPSWASLNRGVLICNECCNVHRSLGRHISQIRSLKKGAWHSSQLALIHTLYNNGANNIWEHLLLDPQGASKLRRKPTPRDPIYPTKADFIRAKYANLSFASKPSKEESPLNLLDINKQLHSCVRTSHVETTLRLLMLGAQPNYIDSDKGTSPMHVAAKEGQRSQIELLSIYGGDPAQPDISGHTPAELSRMNGDNDLCDRLIELQYEATDRLTMYLCGRKPDHTQGQHFVIPEMSSNATITHDGQSVIAKRRLQMLPHLVFEKLVQDVYDEVDRRETDASWLASQQEGILVNERYIAPFLPVNPQFSSTRNQSRQKLAKFNAREFANLIIDVLSEAKRRCTGQSIQDMNKRELSPTAASAPVIPNKRSDSMVKSMEAVDNEGSPEYDDVAMSENDQSVTGHSEVANGMRVSKDSTQMGQSIIRTSVDANNLVTLDDYLEIREQLANSDNKVDQLQQSNCELMRQLTRLQKSVDCLMDDGVQLRMEIKALSNQRLSPRPQIPSVDLSKDKKPPISKRPNQLPMMRTVSASFTNDSSGSVSAKEHSTTSRLRRKESLSSPASVQVTDYDSLSSPNITQKQDDEYSPILKSSSPETVPYPDNIVGETEKLTQTIQKLLVDAQKANTTTFAGHANKIQSVIDRMVSLVPSSFRTGPIDGCLSIIVEACISLTVQCSKPNVDQTPEQQSCQVVNAAFEVAKAAKQLLLSIQSK